MKLSTMYVVLPFIQNRKLCIGCLCVSALLIFLRKWCNITFVCKFVSVLYKENYSLENVYYE